jgi:rSAM/selenodomain-associated transferase 1
LGPVTLWCAPDPGHRLFALLRQRWALDVQRQPQGHLGQRMASAMQAHFHQRPAMPWIVIGTDCPVLTPQHLQAMADALQTHDAVLLPAEDGGYVGLGLARALPAVFEDVAWSTAQVAAQTRERLQRSGARWTELAPLWDVDEPADWQRWTSLGAVS